MALAWMGLVKTTLIDFPGEVAATVFTPGCNLRCPYCHNPDLVLPPYPEDLLRIAEIKAFLKRRAAVLGGVCITGGEPLLHTDLAEFVHFCKNLDLKVKLDTNGTLPERLDCRLFDYIAMDVKTGPDHYDRVTGGDIEDADRRIGASIDKIVKSGVPHEFRTTVVPGIVDDDDVSAIAEAILDAGETADFGKYVVVQFRNGKTLDPAYTELRPFPAAKLEAMAEKARAAGCLCELRGVF